MRKRKMAGLRLPNHPKSIETANNKKRDIIMLLYYRTEGVKRWNNVGFAVLPYGAESGRL
jgi:hypothetical protein